MSPKRMRTSEEEEEHYNYSDPLHTLPDELLRLILSKITDPKTLIVSSIVSKRITSILSNFQSLSLKFPTPPAMVDYDNQLLWVRSLLLIFNRVRSLRIELPCSSVFSGGKIVKWKTETGIRCGVLSLLSSESVSKIDGKKVKVQEEEEEGGRGEGGEAEEVLVARFDDMMGPYTYVRSMYCLMQLLVLRYPNLDSVVLMDSKRHGKLSLQGEALNELRTTMLDLTVETLELDFFRDLLDLFGDSGHDRMWYVPKLLLPLSGYVMKKVMLRVFGGDGVADGNGVGGVGEEVDNGDVFDGGFVDDEDGIFSEAMTQILGKLPFKTRSVRSVSKSTLKSFSLAFEKSGNDE